MARYAGCGEAAVGTNKTILALLSATTVRPRLFEYMVSSGATPADVATIFKLMRLTAVGTEGSGFTPVAMDPADPAALGDYAVAHSAEPTYTASSEQAHFSLNQRATFRWVAVPGCEIVAPASANNGLGLKSISSGGTPTSQATMYHME